MKEKNIKTHTHELSSARENSVLSLASSLSSLNSMHIYTYDFITSDIK